MRDIDIENPIVHRDEPEPRDFDAEDEIEYIKDEMRFERQREERCERKHE